MVPFCFYFWYIFPLRFHMALDSIWSKWEVTTAMLFCRHRKEKEKEKYGRRKQAIDRATNRLISVCRCVSVCMSFAVQCSAFGALHTVMPLVLEENYLYMVPVRSHGSFPRIENRKSKIDLEQILFVCITTFSVSTNAERKWPFNWQNKDTTAHTHAHKHTSTR